MSASCVLEISKIHILKHLKAIKKIPGDQLQFRKQSFVFISATLSALKLSVFESF